MTEKWFMETPTLRALSRLINLYYYFRIGYEHGLANDLDQYVLPADELEALQDLLERAKREKQ